MCGGKSIFDDIFVPRKVYEAKMGSEMREERTDSMEVVKSESRSMDEPMPEDTYKFKRGLAIRRKRDLPIPILRRQFAENLTRLPERKKIRFDDVR